MSNDRLKFRVWDRESKRRHYCEPKIMDNGLWFEFAEHNDDKEPIIEQCTGLKDKHGKLIFEGDIVQYLGMEVRDGKQIYPERRIVITWDYDLLYRLMNTLNATDMPQPEVVGNIHEQGGQR